MSGAWLGPAAWEPVAQGLRELGFGVHLAGLSGLDPGADVAEIGLETHVGEIVRLLEESNLRDVILVGHSYSGLLVGQVADRHPERVAHTVFVEAFLPRDGKSLLDAFSDDPELREAELAEIAANDGRWPPPDAAALAEEEGLSREHREWLGARLVGQPGRTVSEPARLSRSLAEQHATHIARAKTDEPPSPEVVALRDEPSWTFREVEDSNWSHWPMLSAPDQLVAALAEVSRDDETR